jgi:hypothetical protein
VFGLLTSRGKISSANWFQWRLSRERRTDRLTLTLDFLTRGRVILKPPGVEFNPQVSTFPTQPRISCGSMKVTRHQTIIRCVRFLHAFSSSSSPLHHQQQLIDHEQIVQSNYRGPADQNCTWNKTAVCISRQMIISRL